MLPMIAGLLGLSAGGLASGRLLFVNTRLLESMLGGSEASKCSWGQRSKCNKLSSREDS